MRNNFLNRAVALLLFTLAAITARAEFNLNPDVSVKLILLEKQRSGDSKRHSRVNYKVDEDVTDKNGNILIRKGTPAYGTVLNSRRAGMLGRRGSLDVSVDYTTAVDGQKVNLRSSKEKLGSGNKGLITAGALLVAWPLAFCKGSNVTIDAGTTFVAYVNDSVDVKIPERTQTGVDEKNDQPVAPDKIVILKNGDRITGSILSMNGGIYKIRTPLGELNVAEKEVENIQTIETPAETGKAAETGKSELQKRLDALKNKKQQEKKS